MGGNGRIFLFLSIWWIQVCDHSLESARSRSTIRGLASTKCLRAQQPCIWSINLLISHIYLHPVETSGNSPSSCEKTMNRTLQRVLLLPPALHYQWCYRDTHSSCRWRASLIACDCVPMAPVLFSVVEVAHDEKFNGDRCTQCIQEHLENVRREVWIRKNKQDIPSLMMFIVYVRALGVPTLLKFLYILTHLPFLGCYFSQVVLANMQFLCIFGMTPLYIKFLPHSMNALASQSTRPRDHWSVENCGPVDHFQI